MFGDWYFIDTPEYRRHHERLAAERRAAEQAREAEAEKRFQTERAAALTHMRSDLVAGLRELVEALCRRHQIKIEYRTSMPDDVSAYANWNTRTITIPPIVDEQTAATLEEIGHQLEGPCPQTPPHYRDPLVTARWHCLQCELSAQRRALTLCDFTRPMFKSLQLSLGTYRRNTPAHPSARAESDVVLAPLAWHKNQITRWRRELFEERERRQQRVMATLEKERTRRRTR